MKDPKDVVAFVIENGLFTSLALKLAKTYKKVYYYTPWETAFARINTGRIGYGFEDENLYLVDSVWGPHMDEADIVIFPDIYLGPLQEHLVSIGKKVWGARTGDCLELQRVGMKEILDILDLPVGKFEVVKGVNNLRAYIKANPGGYVKIDKWRGLMETFHASSYEDVEPLLDSLEQKLGPFKTEIEFCFEEPLPDRVEFGTDCWAITDENGKCQYPKNLISGLEIKDVGYAGIFTKYADLPECTTRFNERIKPVLAEYGYRGFLSTEVRIGKDHEPFMIDLTCRAPSPPSELFQEMYANLAECIWAGANGIVIEPEAVKPYGAEILLKSSWAECNWQPISFPEEISQWVKIRNACQIDGRHYAVPQQPVGLAECGAVIGLGDTLEEACEKALEHAAQVKGYYLEASTQCIDAIKEQIAKMEEYNLSVF
jgi:hypothetical protein